MENAFTMEELNKFATAFVLSSFIFLHSEQKRERERKMEGDKEVRLNTTNFII